MSKRNVNTVLNVHRNTRLINGERGDDDDDVELHVLGCRLTYWGQTVTNAKKPFALHPQKP